MSLLDNRSTNKALGVSGLKRDIYAHEAVIGYHLL